MKGRGYIIYSILTTVLQEAAVVALVLWLLPLLEVHVPLWGMAILMAAVAAWGLIGYRLTRNIVNQESVTPSSAMIGCEGIAVTPLEPEGVVRVRGELWKARTNHAAIAKNEEIIVEEIDGLILYVAPRTKSSAGIQE